MSRVPATPFTADAKHCERAAEVGDMIAASSGP